MFLNFPPAQYFFDACRRVTFSSPANRLRIAQPILTRRLRALEHELGLELVRRQGLGTGWLPMTTEFRKRGAISSRSWRARGANRHARIKERRRPCSPTSRPLQTARCQLKHAQGSALGFAGIAFDKSACGSVARRPPRPVTYWAFARGGQRSFQGATFSRHCAISMITSSAPTGATS